MWAVRSLFPDRIPGNPVRSLKIVPGLGAWLIPPSPKGVRGVLPLYGRVVPEMTGMPTGQVRHPMRFFILMKTCDGRLHEPP